MTTDHDLERRLSDFYASEAAPRAPDRVLQAALATIDDTRQRRAVLGLPRRFTNMNAYAKLAIAAVAVVAVAAVGLAVMWGGALPPGTDSTPSPLPSPTPTAATVAPSPTSAGPALAETFTSDIHGASMSYPAGWTTQAATKPWADEVLFFGVPQGDFLYDPTLTDHLFLTIASQPIGAATPDEWVAETVMSEGCTATEPITVGGASGVIGAGDCNVAAVTTDGRGYLIWLYTSGDEPELGDIYDRRWFEGVLATVELRPEEAIEPLVVPAADFEHPFSYVEPTGAEFDFGPDYGPTYYETRIPAAADAGTPSGMIVQSVGGGRTDPCDPSSEPLAIGESSRATFDYLATVPGLELTAPTPITVDELTGWQSTVTAPEGAADCPELFLWTEGGPEPLPSGTPLRMISVVVGGEHVVFTIFGEADNPEWDVMADQLVSSIDFQ